jgi:gliding motility-associated-like protein
VPIRIYANDILVANTATTLALLIGGHLSSQITFVLPESVPTSFELTFIVDDAGNGLGIIVELDETNNIDSEFVTIPPLPDFNILSPIISCNRSFGSGQFDFSSYSELVKTNEQQIATFFSNQQDAENNQNQIYNSSNFEANTTPLEIFVRVTNENGCFSITSFILKTRNCPPTVYNYVSANGDGLNDTFFIDGLRNIFLNFEVKIYSRWGILLWTGNQNSADWDGTTTNSTTIGSLVADGTYYYVLTLNDPDYPKPLTGYVYFTR